MSCKKFFAIQAEGQVIGEREPVARLTASFE